MKKIGILVYDVSLTGGAEKIAIELTKELANLYETHLISIFNEKKYNQGEQDKYKYYAISEKTISITKNLLKLSKKVKLYLIGNKIDVLLVITAGINAIAVLSTRNINIKTVYCEHSNLENKTYGKKHEFRQYIGAKYLDKVVTLTSRDKKNFMKQFKLSEERVEVIPNWYKESKEDIKYNTNSKKIISVGRLEKVKGYDMLVKIAKQVKEKHCDWHWDIYGEGKHRQEIEESIRQNKLEDFITLKGNVIDIQKRYQDYAIFILTSYYEGLPLVLLEAQVAKLPIVSFDCPTGPSEIVKDKENGFIIPAYDINKMAESINELIENNKKRQIFSENSQKYLQQFSKENIIGKWKELIDNI